MCVCVCVCVSVCVRALMYVDMYGILYMWNSLVFYEFVLTLYSSLFMMKFVRFLFRLKAAEQNNFISKRCCSPNVNKMLVNFIFIFSHQIHILN